jgi:dihydroxyacetone kinase-like protein
MLDEREIKVGSSYVGEFFTGLEMADFSVTLLDTLAPAIRVLEKSEQEGQSLPQALANFEQAAKKGMQSTKDMLAKMGRASRLGERTIGHQDAGATSCYFILRSLASAGSDR